jgi:drug/metabolite transporter (DMT)-like permease
MKSGTENGGKLSPKLIAALASVYLIWSSTYFAIRVAVQSMPPFLTAGVRYLAAGVVLMAWARMRGEVMPRGRSWLHAAIVALLFFVVGNGFVAVASVHIHSGVVAVVCATMPLWGAVMMPMIGERTSPREWIGLAFGFVGVAVLALGDDLGGDRLATGLLMIAPIGWALGSMLVKKLDVGRGAVGTAMQMIAGGALTLIVSAARGESMPEHVPMQAVVAIVYLATLGSLVGLTAYNYLLTHARPALAMSYAYVNPVIAVFLGAALGGEAISPRVWIAIGLIVPAVIAIVMRPRVPAKAPIVSGSASVTAS